ncbi:MAG: septum site-determining protein MinC [Hydrogenophilales bacterium 28-61-23]|nr:MAG: septum site-determining protein MinC [Hydrogenophilales bacterium 28-61-23]
MPDAMPREEPAFKIKNANLPVLILHLKTPDMDRFKAQLATRIKQMPDFFSHTPIMLGLGDLAEADATLDFSNLLDFMRGHRMQAAGVIGGSAAQQEAAAKAGLGVIPETPARPAPVVEAAPEPVLATAPEPTPEARGPAQPDLPGLESDAEPARPEPPAPLEARPTLIIDKPVRTGQRIYAEGANLVVLAIVNAGAELIADGDIHIYAPLRGRALAGARGNTAARIYVQSMEAELVAIAGLFQVFDEGIPDTLRGKFCQIYLEGEKVAVTPMSSKRQAA